MSNQQASLYPLAPLAGRRFVSDLPAGERPGERLRTHGARCLSAVELLALLMSTADALDMARDILTGCETLSDLARLAPGELEQVPGLGEELAARIVAAVELGRRIATESAPVRPLITRPADVAPLIADMAFYEVEHLRVILLDGAGRARSQITIAIGTPFDVTARMLEIIRPAIVQQARSIVLAHNHPSGQVEPSPEDVSFTKELAQACELVGVNLTDHLIVGQGRLYSMRGSGLMG
jgi:DNA repair protein RadC